MNKRLLLAGSVKTLVRHKLRTFFMSLGIVVGVAALVVMRSMGAGAQDDLLNKLEEMFSAGSILIANSATAGRDGIGELGKLTIDDMRALDDQLDQLIDWDPRLDIGDLEVQYRDRNRTLMIVGHSERFEFVWQRGVEEGEFFSKVDIRSAARVALIGRKAADVLFGDEDPVGKQVQIRNAPFRIKGVLESQGMDVHGLDRDDEIHVPYTTVMQRMTRRETIGSAKILVADTDPAKIDDTVDQIAEILRVRHDLAADENDDFKMFTATGVQQIVREANRVLTVYLPATAGIALLVAAIVIANIMLIGVRERIAEIGLRKAVGATSRQISAQFLLECLALTTISGVLGVGTGIGLLALASGNHGAPISVAADSIVLGLIAAVVVGMLAGYLPARRAALQEPVDALR